MPLAESTDCCVWVHLDTCITVLIAYVGDSRSRASEDISKTRLHRTDSTKAGELHVACSWTAGRPERDHGLAVPALFKERIYNRVCGGQIVLFVLHD